MKQVRQLPNGDSTTILELTAATVQNCSEEPMFQTGVRVQASRVTSDASIAQIVFLFPGCGSHLTQISISRR